VPKDPDAVTALKNLKERVQNGIQKYTGAATTVRPQRLPHTNDFARLARRICGKSIGLVLGGGGARGIAHLVGVYAEFLENLSKSSFRDSFEPLRKVVFQLTTLEVGLSRKNGLRYLLMSNQVRVLEVLSADSMHGKAI